MRETVRAEKISSGIQILRRREIENYLWDKAVLRKALQNNGVDDTVIECILETYPFSNPNEDDMKTCNHQQALFERISKGAGDIVAR